MTCDMEDRHIVAIDLGSSKIALSVAHINGDDIEVIYYKEMPSQGITKSRILTVSRVNEALKPLVEDAEKELSIKITQVVVGMPKYWVRQVTAKALIKDRNADECITEEEIEALKTSAFDTYPLDDNNKECIFGAVAQSFSNGEEFQLLENEIIGMPSEVLEGNFKIFIGKRTPLHNIDVAFNKLGIGVARKYFTPDPVAKSVLTPSEMENGVALIDLGGGATSVSVYYGSIMRHYASIPFGGKSITNDIKTECMISDALAENIKKAFGACMPDKLLNLSEKIIQINSGSSAPNKQLPVKYLSEIITHRVREITEAMLYEIEISGFADNLRNGIVLTGGGAELTNCCNYIKELSGYTVRKGYPRHQVSSNGCSGVFETSAAVSVGLILTAKNDHVTDCVASESTVRQGTNVTFGPEDADETIPETAQENADDRTGTADSGNNGRESQNDELLFPKEEIPVVKNPETGKGGKKGGNPKPPKPKQTPIWTKVKNLFSDMYENISNDNEV